MRDLATAAARIGVWDLDLRTGLRDWDDRMLELFGLDRAGFDPRVTSVADRVHPDDRARVLQTLETAVAAGGTYETEFRISLPTGEVRWVAVRGHALPEGGPAVRVLGVAHETTVLREAAHRVSEALESLAVGYLAVDAGWRITYVNAEGRRIVQPAGQELVGRVLWEVFPDTLGTAFETSYRTAASTGRVVTFDAHYPEPFDAWYEVRAVPGDGGLALYFIDITARRVAEQAAERSSRRVAALGEVALALADADDVARLITVMAERGLAALGADGGAVAVADPTDPGVLLSYVTASYGPGAQAEFGRLPAQTQLPVCEAYRTGRRVLVRDRAAAEAYSPAMARVAATTGSPVYASVPLRAQGRVIGVLTAGWRDVQPFDAEQLGLLDGYAAQCTQALQRLRARDAERAASAEVARFSETLQRSLLTAPPEPDHLQIAVRYSPAASDAYVGGDWYDAFTTASGATSLVIGDVTGHDSRAAAAMAQMRNLLRGIGYTVGDPPAAVLGALDRAVHDLGVGALATIVVAEVEQTPEQAAALGGAGLRTLRWSNAGHPPPLLISARGATRYLESDPDLLVGLDPGARRRDHTALLEPGDSVLLYTDGLVERRGVDLRVGLDWLAGAAAELSHLTLEALCDALLAQVGTGLEDDVALLALRAHPEDRPRPAEAGPGRDPRRDDVVPSGERR